MAKNISRRDLRTELKSLGHIVKDRDGNFTKGTCSDANYGFEESCIINGSCSDNAFNLKSDCLCGAGGIWDGAACSTGTATAHTWTANTWTKASYVPNAEPGVGNPNYFNEGPNFCSDGVSKTAYECKAAANCSDQSNKDEAACLVAGTCTDGVSTTQAQCEGASETWTASGYTWNTYSWMQWQSPNGTSSYDVMKNWEKSPRVIGDHNPGHYNSTLGTQKPGMCICAGGWTYESDYSIGTCGGSGEAWHSKYDCETNNREWVSAGRQVYVCHDPHVLLLNPTPNAYWSGGGSTTIRGNNRLYDGSHNGWCSANTHTNFYRYEDDCTAASGTWTDKIKHVCINQYTMQTVPGISTYAACEDAGYSWKTNFHYSGADGDPFSSYSYAGQINYNSDMEDFHYGTTYQMVYRRLGLFASNTFYQMPDGTGWDYGSTEMQKFGQAYGLIAANGDHTSFTTEYQDLQCASTIFGAMNGLCYTAKWNYKHFFDDVDEIGGWSLEPSIDGGGEYYGFQSIDFIVADGQMKDPNYVNDNYTPDDVSWGQTGSQHDAVNSSLPPDQDLYGEE